MEDIDEIMCLLSWNRTLAEQNEGLRRASRVNCIKCFFQPRGCIAGKPVWENCAKIICARTDEDLEPYIMDMLLWIQDLNWPGAALIQERLILFSKSEMLALLVDKLVRVLSKLDDELWLNSIKELQRNESIRCHLSRETLDILGAITIDTES